MFSHEFPFTQLRCGAMRNGLTLLDVQALLLAVGLIILLASELNRARRGRT